MTGDPLGGGAPFAADASALACDDCGGRPSGHDGPGGDMRCHCGSLLARVVAGGVEVKCRRCKRTVLLAVDKEVPALST